MFTDEALCRSARVRYDRSAGCCIYEMMVGKVLFMGKSEIETIFRIFQVCGTPTEDAGCASGTR